jgi:hypothetical protein
MSRAKVGQKRRSTALVRENGMLYNPLVVSARVPSRSKTWLAYRIRGAKAELLGHVYAPNREEAIAMAAEEYRVPPGRILVQEVGGLA